MPNLSLSKSIGITSCLRATNTEHLVHGVQDFVKLAKWEDGGYHALKQSTEKAQRQLHKLQRQAATALQQPSATVLSAAAKAMGMADLADPEGVIAIAAKRRKKANAEAAPTEQELIAQVGSLCTAVYSSCRWALYEQCQQVCTYQDGCDVGCACHRPPRTQRTGGPSALLSPLS